MEKANPNGLVLLGTNRLEKKNLTCFTLSYKFLLVLSMWGWGYQMWGEDGCESLSCKCFVLST